MSRIVQFVCLGVFLSTSGLAAQESRTAAELAGLIDKLLDAKRGEVPAAPLVDDADFLRRVSLDLIGRIPRVSESRTFLEETAADRRAQLVEKMLESSGYITAMGSYYRSVLLPSNNNMQVFQFQNPQVNAWVEQKIRNNVPYDKIVHEVIAGPTGFGGIRRPGLQPAQPGQLAFSPGAQAFYVANENKAENVASSVSRLFLGVRLECAQCHDHPFASWSRKAFWETAAFFTQVAPPQPRFENGKMVQPKKLDKNEIAIPGTTDTVFARFMDKTRPVFLDEVDPRSVYADWVVSKENPYFAKVAVNRLWAQFFGQGFAEPVDDESTDENPVTHPELLDLLAKEFIASGYDVKHMVRAFTRTAAYQRSSEQTVASQADVRLWARMPVRGLSAEQMYDSLTVAVGMRPSNNPQQQFGFNSPRFDFLTRFASNDRKTDKQTSILQALAMMNGNLVADATSVKTGNTLAAVHDAPFMTTQQKVETLFLATLGRQPRSEERERYETYVDRGGARNDSGAALADVFWVLLNSSEFALNR